MKTSSRSALAVGARDDRVAHFFKERAVQQGVSFDPVWRR